MELLLQIYIFIIGLVFGSFFNVCILRPFSNETITKPKGSKCPKCGYKLAWYDNIPLFSYIILLGKCRNCKTKISWQYPLVELITALLFLFTYLKFGITWQCLFMLIAFSYFVIMSGTDFKEQVVFDMHTIPFISIGVIYGLTQGLYLETALGVLIGTLFMEIIARSGYIFAGQRAFGEGDTYIAAGLGAFLGIKGIILTIILAILIQTFWAFPMIILKYFKNKKYSEILTLFVFVFIIISYVFINNLGGFEQFWIYITYVLLMLSYSYKVCIELIQSTQLESGGGIYLPFGPALFFGATLLIFFNEQIFNLLRQIEWLKTII